MKKILILNILAAGLLASYAKAGEPSGAVAQLLEAEEVQTGGFVAGSEVYFAEPPVNPVIAPSFFPMSDPTQCPWSGEWCPEPEPFEPCNWFGGCGEPVPYPLDPLICDEDAEKVCFDIGGSTVCVPVCHQGTFNPNEYIVYAAAGGQKRAQTRGFFGMSSEAAAKVGALEPKKVKLVVFGDNVALAVGDRLLSLKAFH
jgi:hypothetical protein